MDEKKFDRSGVDLLSIAAHQLRTPLGALRWSTEILLNGDLGDVPQAIKEALQKDYENIKRMINLVNDLLNVSRIEQGRVKDNPTPTNLVIVMKQVLDELVWQIRVRRLTVEFNQNISLPAVMIDPERIRQVLENLLSNAVKYNKMGGFIHIDLSQEGETIKMLIEDNGIGIPSQDKDKISSKFYRASNATHSFADGSGLGLFVVKAYIEGWGGTVNLDSIENQGTKITINLPLNPTQHSLEYNLLPS